MTSFTPGPRNGVRRNRHPPRRGSLGRAGAAPSGALPAQGLSVGAGVAGLLQLAVLARGCGMWRQPVPIPRTHAASCSLGAQPCCHAGPLRGRSSRTSVFGALWPREAERQGRGPERPSSGCPWGSWPVMSQLLGGQGWRPSGLLQPWAGDPCKGLGVARECPNRGQGDSARPLPPTAPRRPVLLGWGLGRRAAPALVSLAHPHLNVQTPGCFPLAVGWEPGPWLSLPPG